ncbi:alpha,alpha-trehalase, partial [bacterium]
MNPAPRLQASPAADLLSPAQRYQELFVAVQRERVFDDSKTFPDAAPRSAPEAILAAYRRESRVAGFDLRAFVHAHFIVDAHVARGHSSGAGRPLVEHIDALWSVLERHPAQHPRGSSLLPLPHDYVVPGGRFVEMYYWDSYFTMLGVAESGRAALVRAMTDNFASLLDRYGRVPNGTRTYYLSRSQPPMFALMVELVEEHEGAAGVRYLPQLRREHAFWMQGEGALGPAQARVVRLPDGSVLNRYWDDLESPREESWREDVATAQSSGRPDTEVYRN